MTRGSSLKYAAFLRAVNVGGRNPVPMAGLRRLFEATGFSAVKTFIQSGNVVFEARRADPDLLARAIGARLRKWLGHDVAVMVRPLAALAALVEENPFQTRVVEPETKLYVAFLAADPEPKPILPLVSEKEGLEAFAVRRRNVFVLSRRVKGRFGFPNNFIERQLRVLATSRNWNTITRMVKAEEGPRAPESGVAPPASGGFSALAQRVSALDALAASAAPAPSSTSPRRGPAPKRR